MIACSNCGSPNDEATRICRYCGTALDQGRRAAEQREYVPPPPLWATEQPPVPVKPYAAGSRPAPGSYRCPRCGTTQPPLTEKKISTEGWIVFAVLLVFCLPLFWIGLLMKKEHRICSMCHADLG